MERVVTINLNGNSYQLEEPAYDALRAYLARAEATLADNPDKAEIVRDLEQAIADKCSGYLSPAKTVVNADEMSLILEEMGPVDGDASNMEAPPREDGLRDARRKRLYRIRDGAMIAGICSGLSAYLDIDVTIIRVLAVVFGFITSGWLFLVYLIAMFIIPSAHTSEEWAQAHGVPFNAQEVIDRAKREYARVSEDISRDWRSSWRAQRRAWRERSHSWRAGPFFADVHGPSWRAHDAPPHAPAQPVGYATRIFAGLGAFVLSVVGAALLIAFLVALFALLNTGAVFNWSPPADIPLWLAIVVLCIAYGAISTPLRYLRRASYAAASGYSYQGRPSGDFIAFLAMIAGGVLAYQFIPEFRVWVEALPGTLRAIGQSLEAL